MGRSRPASCDQGPTPTRHLRRPFRGLEKRAPARTDPTDQLDQGRLFGMRRFYSDVSLGQEIPGSWTILLDGRVIRTPAGAAMCVPTRALAQEIAAEWSSQAGSVDPFSMPLTRLVNVVLDHTPSNRGDMAIEVSRYCETDLLCHLAETPEGLVRLQQNAWGPVRDWASRELGIRLLTCEGIIAVAQPEASLEAARAYALGLDDYRLTALVWACGLYGSALLGLAFLEGRMDAIGAFELSRLDEEWQMREWGEDSEARAAAESRRGEAASLGRLIPALSGWP